MHRKIRTFLNLLFATFLAGLVQPNLLLPKLFCFEPNLGADALQILLGLMGVGMKLSQMLAQLPADLGEFLATVPRLLFQFRKLFLESDNFVAQRM